MDLNLDSALFCCDLVKGSDKFRGLGYGGKNACKMGHKSTHVGDMFAKSPEDGCQLVLGLGPTPSAYAKSHPDVVKDSLASDTDSALKLGFSEVTKEGLSVLEGSVTGENFFNSHLTGLISPEACRVSIPVVDEGSTSAKNSGGYLPSLLLDPRQDNKNYFEWLDLGTTTRCPPSQPSCELSATTEVSVGTISDQTATATSSDHRTSNLKKCKFPCCSKGARGASGLCIGHGGGQRCQKPGCNKGAESRTAYCKAHGGGRRCQELGCTKSAEGRTEYCIAHGGGRRCGYPGGCTKAARGRSGLCIKHGGGKRCKMEGCLRSAEGQAGVCISHGGGRRCQSSGCPKGAQGSTMYCKAHGGGKRCVFAGCTKGAEGSTPLCKGHGGGKRCLFDGGGICPKSVHGGTNFCVAHGGGKRCAMPGCTKSARGRTDSCVKHGGGKRCKFENCDKSAQGSTDFCKAHGGGKRCTWAGEKCDKFARGKSGLCAAHSSIVQGQGMRKAGGVIRPGLFHGIVSAAVSLDHQGNPSSAPAKRQQLIPPNVLVPTSMKSPTAYSSYSDTENSGTASRGEMSLDALVPEGRVHGGGLLSLLGGNLRKAVDGI